MFVVILCLLSACALVSGLDSFTEELLLKPLYSEHLYAHFHFSTVWNTNQQTCKLLKKGVLLRFIGFIL